MKATQEQLVIWLDRLIEQAKDDLIVLVETIAVQARSLVTACERIREKALKRGISARFHSLGELQAAPSVLDRLCMQFAIKQAHLQELERQRTAWE